MEETNELEEAAESAPGRTPPHPAADPVDHVVVEAFRQVLRLEVVDPGVPFAALGGDSMRAVRVLSRLWRELGVELPVHTLGNATTAAQLATTVREHAGGSAS